MILLVNQHTVPLFVDVANAFAESGHETRLMTGFVEHGRIPLSSKVKKVGSLKYNRTNSFTRLASWTAFTIHYFFYLCFSRKPECIIVVTNPPISIFATALVAKWRRIPFHIVVFDLYPEALEQAGLSNRDSWLYRKWQRDNEKVFARAAGIITLSESMKAAVSKYCSPDKVKVIFNWADTEYIRPIDKNSNPFIHQHQLLNKIVVLYSGNMGLTHDLESLVRAAKIVGHDERIRFVLIGEGGKKKKLEAIANELKLTNIIFLPYQDSAMFPFAMASADIGIVTLGTGAEGISVPSKTYVNMAAGLAIVAISPPNSELNRIVTQFNIGYSVEPDQPSKLAEVISRLIDQPEELHKFRDNSRAASFNFTSDNAVQYVQAVANRTTHAVPNNQ